VRSRYYRIGLVIAALAIAAILLNLVLYAGWLPWR
jgi:hypothetical protein